MLWIVFAGKELFRKKIVLVTSVLTLLFIGLFNFGLYKLMHQSRLIKLPFEGIMEGVTLLSLGLLFAGMIVAFLVFFATMGAISGEVENGLMLAVLARPIPRWKVYLGKYFGTAFWIAIYCTVLFMALLLPVQQMADVPLAFGSILRAWLLFVWGPMLLLAVSMLGSVFFPMLGNGVACAILYGLSLFSGFAETLISARGGNTFSGMLLAISMLMPSNSLFSRVTYEIINGLDLPLLPDIMSQLGPFSPSNIPSPSFIGYSVFYWAALLALGCFALKRKDIA
ncbi:ABC transporter permease [Paenibacillus rhizovicinus]|uniref:ABC transporter permease n=1 Tax=Paenibacillus rhizovicinus TaxID=2704463 RepID=A0A6C0NYE0_9BACL|nr:ABC transporter permease subunit [Paenibacillus rhizovicinus]QHW31255.1 ABC transporter permease [Paenibacillus rhizovicinus]